MRIPLDDVDLDRIGDMYKGDWKKCSQCGKQTHYKLCPDCRIAYYHEHGRRNWREKYSAKRAERKAA